MKRCITKQSPIPSSNIFQITEAREAMFYNSAVVSFYNDVYFHPSFYTKVTLLPSAKLHT